VSAASRAAWLLARRARWCGLSLAEAVDGDLSPRVEDLITEMRELGMFPELWTELEVIAAFLCAIADARQIHRGRYCAEIRASEGQEIVHLGFRAGHRLDDGRVVRSRA